MGPPGSGKFAAGIYLGRRFMCPEGGSEDCGCSCCRKVNSFNHPDFLLVFPFPNLAGESRKNTVFHFSDPVNSSAKYSDETLEEVRRFIEEKGADNYRVVTFEKKQNIPAEVVRDLIRAVARKPMLGDKRVVMVCDVEKMAFGAADLFLKTVEEPPEDTLVILTCSRPNLLQPTLLSRVIKFRMAPTSDEEIKKYLSQHELQFAEFHIRCSMGSPGMARRAVEDELDKRRDALWNIVRNYVETGGLAQTIEKLHRHFWRTDYEDVRNDFRLLTMILRDIYVCKFGLDNRLANADIDSEIKAVAGKAPEPSILRRWISAAVRAMCVHEVNNVSADMAFIGAFIEFHKANQLLGRES